MLQADISQSEKHKMTGRIKLIKLLGRIQLLISKSNITNDRTIQQRIDQSYYLMRIDTLKTLLIGFEGMQKEQEVINQFMTEEYSAVFYQWRKDVRWVNNYLRNRALSKPIL